MNTDSDREEENTLIPCEPSGVITRSKAKLQKQNKKKSTTSKTNKYVSSDVDIDNSGKFPDNDRKNIIESPEIPEEEQTRNTQVTPTQITRNTRGRVLNSTRKINTKTEVDMLDWQVSPVIFGRPRLTLQHIQEIMYPTVMAMPSIKHYIDTFHEAITNGKSIDISYKDASHTYNLGKHDEEYKIQQEK